jgi:hypothetical protein
LALTTDANPRLIPIDGRNEGPSTSKRAARKAVPTLGIDVPERDPAVAIDATDIRGRDIRLAPGPTADVPRRSGVHMA